MANEYVKSTDEYLHDLAWADYAEEHGYEAWRSPYTQYEFDAGWYLHKISQPLPEKNEDAYSADMEAGYRAREQAGLS